jgi:excinuclease UvrABC nuclease subunit
MNVVPEAPGVYVLRNFPSLSGIIYIGSSKNLWYTLQKHLISGDIPEEITFFDWYPTETIEQARQQEKSWILQFSPKYNVHSG